jgi:polyhydroxyalkanoate synthesis regulator phasin
VADPLQTYINMVTGVTKSTQEKASATARALLKQAGLDDVAAEASERVTKLTEEIMNASRTNRELLQHFVLAEVDKVAARLGLARTEDVQALRDEIASLRAQLNKVTAGAARTASAKKVATKRASARKAAATMRASTEATATSPPDSRPAVKPAATAETVSPGAEQ